MSKDTAPRLKLLFVSTRFLFPADTGGQIRTSQVLRGMKGQKFDITLASPAPDGAVRRFKNEIDSVSDHFVSWPDKVQDTLYKMTRMRHFFSNIPIPVVTDWSASAKRVIDKELSRSPDVVVFDFPHSAILAPDEIKMPSVLFTHNVEAEIFRRHVEVSEDPLRRFIWSNQYRKMFSYEKATVALFDEVVAVSERDKETLCRDYAIKNVSVIRTGVDLDFFKYTPPVEGSGIVFTGSMDWMANIDGIEFFMDEVWPLIDAAAPDATMTVVGRNPPAQLVDRMKGPNWKFTGFVDDIRPYMEASSVYVVPLRVGGGTRMKVFEAMASGCPLVSTAIGVEGLPLVEGEHYLGADSPEAITEAVLRLLKDSELRIKLSQNARKYVEDEFSCTRVALEFEEICAATLKRVSAHG